MIWITHLQRVKYRRLPTYIITHIHSKLRCEVAMVLCAVLRCDPSILESFLYDMTNLNHLYCVLDKKTLRGELLFKIMCQWHC